MNEPGQAEMPLVQPDLETLMEWQDEGGCEAACPHHCWVEPDANLRTRQPKLVIEIGPDLARRQKNTNQVWVRTFVQNQGGDYTL